MLTEMSLISNKKKISMSNWLKWPLTHTPKRSEESGCAQWIVTYVLFYSDDQNSIIIVPNGEMDSIINIYTIILI